MKKSIVLVCVATFFLIIGLVGCSDSADSQKRSNTITPDLPEVSKSIKLPKKKNSLVKNEVLLHLLKMDPISLKDELKTGKSIIDIGKEKNVTEDQMIGALMQKKISNLKLKGMSIAEINNKKVSIESNLKKSLEKKN